MGNEDSASAEEARAFIPGEANAFLSANVERLAGGEEQAASEEMGRDCGNSPEAGFDLTSVKVVACGLPPPETRDVISTRPCDGTLKAYEDPSSIQGLCNRRPSIPTCRSPSLEYGSRHRT